MDKYSSQRTSCQLTFCDGLGQKPELGRWPACCYFAANRGRWVCSRRTRRTLFGDAVRPLGP
jgi:hypothetical protein